MVAPLQMFMVLEQGLSTVKSIKLMLSPTHRNEQNNNTKNIREQYETVYN